MFVYGTAKDPGLFYVILFSNAKLLIPFTLNYDFLNS